MLERNKQFLKKQKENLYKDIETQKELEKKEEKKKEKEKEKKIQQEKDFAVVL